MVRVLIREQGSILCTSGSAPAGFSTLDRTIAVEICAWLYVACDLIGETEGPTQSSLSSSTSVFERVVTLPTECFLPPVETDDAHPTTAPCTSDIWKLFWLWVASCLFASLSPSVDTARRGLPTVYPSFSPQLLPSLHYSPSSVSSRFFYSLLCLSALLRSLILEILFSAFLISSHWNVWPIPLCVLADASLPFPPRPYSADSFRFNLSHPNSQLEVWDLLDKSWSMITGLERKGEGCAKSGSVRGGASWRGLGPELDRQ